MAEKKVKIIDIHEQYKKLNKVSKKIAGFGVVVGIISAVLLIGVSVLYLVGAPFITSGVRQYRCAFYSYTQDVFFDKTYYRGEKLDEDYKSFDTSRPDDADGTTYTFIGWDITGDMVPDVIPTKMYYSFKAAPIYFKFNPYGILDGSEPATNPIVEANYETK